ncbi:MAG TPA: hypothetical protein VGQ67_10065 [Candidatus Polarisedimenticolia bacterium]|jgi:hypothetical protein|nr:hypothetical protein [Candidatus Polarisedimenticolia bacterium]
MKRLLVAATALLLCSTAARAHEVRPAYLEVRVTSDAEAEAFFKVPVRGPGQKPFLEIVWPDGTTVEGAVGRFEGTPGSRGCGCAGRRAGARAPCGSPAWRRR